jgi:hypothetical protein
LPFVFIDILASFRHFPKSILMQRGGGSDVLSIGKKLEMVIRGASLIVQEQPRIRL